MKIVTGGQTGVDRAALDAALESGVKAGGWCPEGRVAEDGIIPDRYPLLGLSRAGYRQRTRRNVIDSDGTAIIYFGHPEGGTEQTIAYCIKERKPYLLIDAEEVSIERAAGRIERFVASHSIAVLNVAGPRASGESRAYAYARKLILSVLRIISRHSVNNQDGLFGRML